MKKLMTLLGALTLIGTVALAADDDDGGQRYYGPGYGQGMMESGMMQGYQNGGHMMGRGMMDGYGQGYGRGWNRSAEPLDEKGARMKLEAYLSDHMKGYKIVKMEENRMPMGSMYWALVKDDQGNEFELHVNPYGDVRGPFPR